MSGGVASGGFGSGRSGAAAMSGGVGPTRVGNFSISNTQYRTIDEFIQEFD